MGELIKLIVDLLVLKQTADRGAFSWFVMFVGLAVTIVVFGVGYVVGTYCDRHPEVGSGPIIGMLVFAVVALGVTVWWGRRYQNRQAASRRAAATRSLTA